MQTRLQSLIEAWANTIIGYLIIRLRGIYFALATIAFLFLTAPVSAHLLAKEAYRTHVKLWEGTWLDELKKSVDEED